MASLQNQQIDQTYAGLIKTNDEAALGATEKVIQDGAGNNSTLSMGTASASFTGTLDLSGATVTGFESGVQTVVAGTNITVDNTDPANPIVAASGSAAGLVSGDGTDTMKSDASLTTSAAQAYGSQDIALGNNVITGDSNNVDATSNCISIGDNIGGGYADRVIKIGNDIPDKSFNNDQIFIGNVSTIGGRNNTCIGFGTPQVTGDEGVLVGYNAVAGHRSVALGANATSSSSNSITIGEGAVSTGSGGDGRIAIGRDASATNNKAVVVGVNGCSSASEGIAIGDNVDIASSSDRTIAIGNAINVGGGAADSIVMGTAADSSAQKGIALGFSASVTATEGIALGYQVTAATDYTVTLKRLQMLDYASLNYADDTAAAAGGIPLGGVYHNAGALRIRIA